MLIGNTKSGKTHSILNVLQNPTLKILDRLEFQNIYILSKSVHLCKTMK